MELLEKIGIFHYHCYVSLPEGKDLTLDKVADLSPHFRKQAATDGTKLDLNIGNQGLAAWFRAKSTTTLLDTHSDKWCWVIQKGERLQETVIDGVRWVDHTVLIHIWVYI